MCRHVNAGYRRDMRITDVLTVMPVADHAATVGWYERLLGRAADNVPMPSCHEWQLTDRGWLQVVDDSEHAGSSMMTIAVSDIDAEARALANRSVEVVDVRDVSTAMRLGTITDPSGNAIYLAQDVLDV
jgi:predicted enzyme related to lactoylglutathione lyase